MLDKDLATLYGIETKVLNQTVKRNIERFPDDFRFELSREECLRSQFVTSNILPNDCYIILNGSHNAYF